jgi:hypothetical protein
MPIIDLKYCGWIRCRLVISQLLLSNEIWSGSSDDESLKKSRQPRFNSRAKTGINIMTESTLRFFGHVVKLESPTPGLIAMPVNQSLWKRSEKTLVVLLSLKSLREGRTDDSFGGRFENT